MSRQDTEESSSPQKTEDLEPGHALAVKLSESANAAASHLTGVLLTLAKSVIEPGPRLNSYKTFIRREIYNDVSDRVDIIQSIVGRANVKSFRVHSTLEEQLRQPATDHTLFDEER